MQREISRQNFVEVLKLRVPGIVFWMGNGYEKKMPSPGSNLLEQEIANCHVTADLCFLPPFRS